jgi:hypothetical protein
MPTCVCVCVCVCVFARSRVQLCARAARAHAIYSMPICNYGCVERKSPRPAPAKPHARSKDGSDDAKESEETRAELAHTHSTVGVGEGEGDEEFMYVVANVYVGQRRVQELEVRVGNVLEHCVHGSTCVQACGW